MTTMSDLPPGYTRCRDCGQAREAHYVIDGICPECHMDGVMFPGPILNQVQSEGDQ